MKKVINIILLVVLGVSLSGCEWLYGLYFGIDGGSAYTPSVNSIMTEIAQCGCEGEVVNFFSFVEGGNMVDNIPPVIGIKDYSVKFDAMKEDEKGSIAMNVKINGEKDNAFKFYCSGNPVGGINIKSFIETVHTFGSKYDNNHSYEWNSEFFCGMLLNIRELSILYFQHPII